eukprot:TRINITY_DN31402_c0_g1_i2.p1 TRINITY_DN31402_c0_g1~~TRINITY_DN31402_c0_g1_i2.p1  ORF type:complete len:100 (-),score=3.93 TRINITY_DN31402_c0_g1_i2:7-306(-)
MQHTHYSPPTGNPLHVCSIPTTARRPGIPSMYAAYPLQPADRESPPCMQHTHYSPPTGNPLHVCSIPTTARRPGIPSMYAAYPLPVSYTHLTLPTNREV